jgi:hypothetical protein
MTQSKRKCGCNLSWMTVKAVSVFPLTAQAALNVLAAARPTIGFIFSNAPSLQTIGAYSVANYYGVPEK